MCTFIDLLEVESIIKFKKQYKKYNHKYLFSTGLLLSASFTVRLCVYAQMAVESARQFATTTPYQSTSGLVLPFKMESSTGDACVFGKTFQQPSVQHQNPHQQQQQQSAQCYMNDVTDDQLMRQQMTMMMAYQDGGYSVLPPVGARLRHDEATPGERSVNFTHPFSITNIMSARQRQQQLLRTAEFDDVKARGFPSEESSTNDVTNYSYHHPRLMPPPCGLQAPYAGHVTDRKSATATPCLNGGVGDDAPHYEVVSTTTDERQSSPIQ